MSPNESEPTVNSEGTKGLVVAIRKETFYILSCNSGINSELVKKVISDLPGIFAELGMKPLFSLNSTARRFIEGALAMELQRSLGLFGHRVEVAQPGKQDSFDQAIVISFVPWPTTEEGNGYLDGALG